MLKGNNSENSSLIKLQLDDLQYTAEKMSAASAEGLQAIRDDLVLYLSNPSLRDDDDSSSDESPEGDDKRQPLLFRSLDEIKARLESLHHGIYCLERQTRVLQHIYFDGIFAREDSIENASEGTFAWMLLDDAEFMQHIFNNSLARGITNIRDTRHPLPENAEMVTSKAEQAPDWTPERMSKGMDSSRALLLDWLIDGHGVFHVSGKAGSGKSTLMKLISNHPRTTEYLQQWAGQKTLVVASFFFWSSGTELQMSLQGLYRSILFLVLRQCPELIPEIFPRQWETLSSISPNRAMESDMFRAAQIKDAFDLLMAKPVSSDTIAFCFFIDGLDEYKAHAFDHKKLAVQLREWAHNNCIKMCVSSRPHVEFIDTFSPDLRINLHELTAYDIYHFSREMFENDENFARVEPIYLELAEEILEMAEGVFLWAHIVVKSVITEVGLHATHERLRQKIRNTPREMDALYDGMLSSLDRADMTRAHLFLYLVLTNPFNSLLNALCLGWVDDIASPDFPSARHLAHIHTEDDIFRTLEATRRQITGLTKGLLTVTSNAPVVSGQRGLYFACRVQLFHQTARDYLMTPSRKSQFALEFPGFDPYHTHSLLRMAEVALGCQRTFSLADLARWSYGLDFFRIELRPQLEKPRDESLIHESRYQQTHKNMALYSQLCANHFRARYVEWPEMSATVMPMFEEQASFPHLAAAHRQINYLRKEFGTAADASRILETFGEASRSRDQDENAIQASSLLLCACYDRFDPGLVSFLLALGLSTQFRLRVFNMHAEPTEETVPFWSILVGLVVSRVLPIRTSVRRGFDVLAQILQAEPQDEVLLAITQGGVGYIMTLRDFVVATRPPNMQTLLELLPMNERGQSRAAQLAQGWNAPGIQTILTFDSTKHTQSFWHQVEKPHIAGVITDKAVLDFKTHIFRLW